MFSGIASQNTACTEILDLEFVSGGIQSRTVGSLDSLSLQVCLGREDPAESVKGSQEDGEGLCRFRSDNCS